MPDLNHRADDEKRILGVIGEAINLNAMEETERAVHLLKSMLSEFLEEPAVHLYLAWYLRGCDHLEEAIEHARRAVQLLPRSSKASLVAFHTLWKAGCKEDAIEEIRRFVPIRPTERYTSGYVDILKKWESGDLAKGVLPKSGSELSRKPGNSETSRPSPVSFSPKSSKKPLQAVIGFREAGVTGAAVRLNRHKLNAIALDCGLHLRERVF